MKQPGPFTRITQRQVSSLETIKCVSACSAARFQVTGFLLTVKATRLSLTKPVITGKPHATFSDHVTVSTPAGVHIPDFHSRLTISHTGMQHSYLA